MVSIDIIKGSYGGKTMSDDELRKHLPCKHLPDLNKAESDLIKRHIDDHLWFRKIENRQQGVKDFIEEYGWIMREFYCGHVCPDRENCELAKQFQPKKIKPEEESKKEKK